jgi:undecaprenyl-diphosphatase
LFEAILLGIIQGLTEFLPISSSAHIRIAGEFMDKAQDPGARFTAITQIGTELAVLIFFRKDIVAILRAWFISLRKSNALNLEEKQASRMGWLIIIGSIPIVVLGYFGRHVIENDLRSLWLIATVMIVFGIILGFADKFGSSQKTLSTLTNKHGLYYGLAQAMALIPGVSRSGATIAMGRALGYSRESALRYSFLLAIPAVFGSGLYQLSQALSDNQNSSPFSISQTLIATAIAFVVGYIVIAWLIKFVMKRSFMPFIIYRIALGSTLLVLLATGVINS